MSDDRSKSDLDALEQRIAQARESSSETRGEKKQANEADRQGLALAFRVGIELVSAVAVGLGIGWLLDEWLGTRPWLMLVFILLGGGAGILNVFRMARGYGYAAGYRTEHTQIDDTDDRRAS